MIVRNAGKPKDFLDRVKSISVAAIAREANRPISVAVVGTPELRAEALNALFAKSFTASGEVRALPASPFLEGYDSTLPVDGFPRQPEVFDFIIDVGGGREGVAPGTLVFAVAELGGWEPMLERILTDRPDLALPLARNFPVFRRRVAQQIITQYSVTNAQFTLLTGVVAQFPLFELIGIPGSALSDLVVLTKNQIMMTLRLAAAHGLELDYRSRMKELAPILVNAFGWRAIARELVGAIPGFGFLARASISFAGTFALGKAAQTYYETGETVTRAQMKRLYEEAYASARDRVKAIAETLRRGGGEGGHRSRRPAAIASADDLTVDTQYAAADPVQAAGERTTPA